MFVLVYKVSRVLFISNCLIVESDVVLVLSCFVTKWVAFLFLRISKLLFAQYKEPLIISDGLSQ